MIKLLVKKQEKNTNKLIKQTDVKTVVKDYKQLNTINQNSRSFQKRHYSCTRWSIHVWLGVEEGKGGMWAKK